MVMIDKPAPVLAPSVLFVCLQGVIKLLASLRMLATFIAQPNFVVFLSCMQLREARSANMLKFWETATHAERMAPGPLPWCSDGVPVTVYVQVS